MVEQGARSKGVHQESGRVKIFQEVGWLVLGRGVKGAQHEVCWLLIKASPLLAGDVGDNLEAQPVGEARKCWVEGYFDENYIFAKEYFAEKYFDETGKIHFQM